MTDPVVEAALTSTLPAEIESARWYQGKSRELLALRLVDRVEVPGTGGGVLAIVAADYGDGATDEYALVLRPDATGTVHGATGDDVAWHALARLSVERGALEGDNGTVVGRPASPVELPPAASGSRLLQPDQSNTSVVLGESVVLKCYRRLRAGPHPEQELLRGLTRIGSERAPRLLGALSYDRDGVETALATTYSFVRGEPVGWEPLIVSLATALRGPVGARERLAAGTAELGRCAAELHRDLLTAFGSRLASRADADVRRGRASTDVGEALASVTETAPELVALGPRSDRALAGFAELEGTSLQRVHGDLHVGQLLRCPTGVVAIDFEGDPASPPEQRLQPDSRLEDVAGLLLSLDHVAAAAARRSESRAAAADAFAWAAAARAATSEAYDAVLPPSEGGHAALLHAYEVEREWREALYAGRVLPEWLYAPRLVLPRLLA